MEKMTMYYDTSIFNLERIPQIPAEANDYVQMELSFEMNLDLLKIKRTYYDLLDALSDVGGISSLTLSVFGVAILIINHNILENYLAIKLFKLQT